MTRLGRSTLLLNSKAPEQMTADLVITSSDSSLAPSLSVTHCSPSDHFPIFTKLYVDCTPLPPLTFHSFHHLHSIVSLCAIDVSKAFDKVNHHALFTKLMKRHVPNALLCSNVGCQLVVHVLNGMLFGLTFLPLAMFPME